MSKGTLVKSALTVFGAVLLSTLGIFASDSLRGIDFNLAQLGGSGSGACPAGMVALKVDGEVLCADAYEASPSAKCPNQSPRSVLQSEQNMNAENCYAASVKGAQPWSFISLPQAQRACAAAGKRLPTSDEWYHIALGTDPTLCVTKGDTPRGTGDAQCISTIGAFDLIGNVWEWVDESVVGYSYHERAIPEEGYVASVDASGIAITSSQEPDQLYGEDYFWSKPEGVYGMIRGGYYGSGNDAGLYAANVSVETSFATQGVGFRCVEDVL